ncbi:relaxase/mobilization nuclease domain-containing protein [Proteus mirabilis]|uniref:TraI/MobA(P) family conjugative relaxase n=3 Tax=Proteus mirabilis TaxID=584 RepID=UPI00217EE949|nr:TraI/MobA(P) family conjugative relaxase [Proteus mirabilis]MCS6748158.1 relaxase/mobilization nuclease domain-containing protein [Proteus mirabilis]
MIAKHVAMRSKSRSSFAGLVNYITDNQGKKERLGLTQITNCASSSLEAATGEILATQKLNTRTESDKTYHLIVSFPTGETPDKQVLEAIENRICEGLGFSEHQRISAIHNDTDNLHIHIAINKIHPTSLTIHEPFRDYKTLGSLCDELESKYKLTKENHINSKTLSQNRANDMEKHSGIESLVSWIKKECEQEIKQATNWEQLHQTLSESGLKVKNKGNGFIFESEEGIQVKASTIAREFSKNNLEKKLGAFIEQGEHSSTIPKKKYKKKPVSFRVDTTKLYEQYQEEQKQSLVERKRQREELSFSKNIKIEEAKKASRLRRAAIKLMGGNRLTKKILYAQANSSLKKKLELIHKEYKEKRSEQSSNLKLTWADWLKKKATEGDEVALKALRAREQSKGLKGNTIKSTKNNNEKYSDSEKSLIKDSVTKKGTIIYRSEQGAIRDDGKQLQVSKDAKNEAIKEALLVAIKKYGNEISVNGTPQFKAQVVHAAATFNLPVTFKDDFLERHKNELAQRIKERNYEERRRNDGRRIDHASNANARSRGGDTEYPGTRTTRKARSSTTNREFNRGGEIRNFVNSRNDNGYDNFKPNVSRIGGEPPSIAKNRLRTMSSLSVVRFTRRSEMLLQSHVSSQLEHKGTESNNTLRRGVLGARLNEKEVAINQYIQERESKRIKGFDIPKHSRYNNEKGELRYGGVRTVNEQSLALIKKDNDVLVLAVDKLVAQKLKKLKIGDSVTISNDGIIKRTKGRSR